jgi:serine/threonine protein kinase
MFLHFGKRSPREHVLNWDPICHMDLHPKNIFLSNEGRWSAHPRVVLGDFGCSVFKSDIRTGSDRGEVLAHPGWNAPECRARGYAGVRRVSDVWQLAGICQALGRFVSIPDHWMGTNAPLGPRYSARLNRVVGRMSAYNPQSRPSSRDIVVDLEPG